MNSSILKKAAGTILLTATVLTLGAQAASADQINFINNGALLGPATGPMAAKLDVACNMYNHKISATMAVAPEPGYESGQYISYRITVRDLDTNQVTNFKWQGPYWVYNTSYVNGGITYINQGRAVPGFTINAAAGHRYFVSATVEWWNPNRQAYELDSPINQSVYAVYYYQSGSWRWGTFGSCWT